MERQPYKTRLRNRFIALGVFVFLCMLLFSCIFGGNKDITNDNVISESIKYSENIEKTDFSDNLKTSDEPFDKKEEQIHTQEAIAEIVTPDNPPAVETIDSTYIKEQTNVFLAEKIDNMLRRFKPLYGVILVVDAQSNEIIAWGERKDEKIQTQPDFFVKNTFPAASLAKTVTIAAAMESKRYSLNTPIPMIGAHHTLYKNQLRVKPNYTGPTIELQDAYAKSANPPLALIGLNLGAKRLKEAAKKLGYNMNFSGDIPKRSSYTPPDSGYGLAEVSCGFTESTTLTPLLAAAQVRSIITKKPLEIPWAKNLSPFAPKHRITLDVEKFSDNTYYGLKEAMIRSIVAGTGKKQISSRNISRKNLALLNIGGKTGSLDGHDPYGRYEWFKGFAESKEDPKKAIVIVILQIHDLQKVRSQPATQVAALIINYWAQQNLSKKGK